VATSVERHYADRVLPVDLETSHIWGELTAAAQKIGKIIPASDGLIAATARRHGLHVMTRNTEHFEPTGVMLVNPWTAPES
jgi:predicted nucleic acid-binding protein